MATMPQECFLYDEDRFVRHGLKSGRMVYRNLRGTRYYTYDFTHDEVEVFNKRGRHLGSEHPVSEDFIKDAVKGREQEI